MIDFQQLVLIDDSAYEFFSGILYKIYVPTSTFKISSRF